MPPRFFLLARLCLPLFVWLGPRISREAAPHCEAVPTGEAVPTEMASKMARKEEGRSDPEPFNEPWGKPWGFDAVERERIEKITGVRVSYRKR